MDTSTAQQVNSPNPTSAFRRVAFKDRFIARLYDTALFWFLYLLVSGYLDTFSLMLFGIKIGWFVCYGLFLLRDGFNRGAGFGKARQSILVINTDNYKECSYIRSVLRNVVSDISAILITIELLQNNLTAEVSLNLAFLTVLLIDIWRVIRSDGGRRTGDLIAHTQVVYWEDSLHFDMKRKEEEMLDDAVSKLKKSREK